MFDRERDNEGGERAPRKELSMMDTMVVEWWRDVKGRRRNSELRESSQRRGSRPRDVSRAAKRHRTCREFKAPERENEERAV